MNQKKVVIGILAALALVAIGVFVWEKSAIKPSDTNPGSQADTKTKNWKTYQNDEYGIEFEYPETLLYVTDGVDGAEVFDINIIQNGRTRKDIDKSGGMSILLNDFASQKYGVAKEQGLCEGVDVFGKKGEVCDEKVSDKGRAKDAFLSFIENGTCSENVSVIFFEPEYSNKTAFGMNSIYISCDQNNQEIIGVFQKIYQTIRFSDGR
jgi:hypothetical protein